MSRAGFRCRGLTAYAAAIVVATVSGIAAAQQQPTIEVAPDTTPIAPGPSSAVEDGGWGSVTGLSPDREAASVPGVRVEMRGLDKLTGQVDSFNATVGSIVMYERMRIEVKTCYAQESAQAPESSVFLQIYDMKYDPAPLSFSGWMFASSPALSAMDHPRYDVWVLSCNTS